MQVFFLIFKRTGISIIAFKKEEIFMCLQENLQATKTWQEKKNKTNICSVYIYKNAGQ